MTLVLGVLVASVIGSFHCAAMCGGFVCLYAGPASTRGLNTWSSHMAYNAGRLVSYSALGAVAGALGAGVNGAGRFVGSGRGATIVAGTLMIAWALANMGAQWGIRVPGSAAPDWAKRRLGSALVAVAHRSPTTRAMAIGLVTTLLPCGWLYTFVATAGGTGHALTGLAVMLAFWAGTVPMLLLVGQTTHRLLGGLSRRLPQVAALVVLVLGILSLAGKLEAPGTPMHAHAAMGGISAVR